PNPNKPAFTSSHPVFTVTGASVNRDNNVSVGGTSVSTHASIGYSGIARLELDGGNTGNEFDVQSTTKGIPTTINAGTGKDMVDLGGATAQKLDFIQGAIPVNGQGANTTLNINDQNTTASQDYEVYASSIHRRSVTTTPEPDDMEPVRYFNVGNLFL